MNEVSPSSAASSEALDPPSGAASAAPNSSGSGPEPMDQDGESRDSFKNGGASSTGGESAGGGDAREQIQESSGSTKAKRMKMEDGVDESNCEGTSQDTIEEEPKDEEGEKVISPVIGKKPLVGRVWKNKKGEIIRYHCDSYDVDYRPGDAVYIESQRPDQPFYICVIQDLKMTKRDTLMIHIKWFYRTSEVPEQVYQLLIQDRHTEHTTGAHKSQLHKIKVDLAALQNPLHRTRELFISEMTDMFPIAVLRGKCKVLHCADIKAVKEFQPDDNTFFYTLSYNPETRRLASTQGEIRVGASHQAKLPKYEGDVPVEDRPEPWGEELTWCPDRIHDHDLIMFLRAARSMAAFAAMCDGGSPDDGYQAASRDGITATAIQTLHECEYDTGRALQSLLKEPFPDHDVFRKWPEEDIKNFIKGLRVHGKNFFKIREEFLPERDTADLIEFYYLWKKTSGAANNRPRGRRIRPNVMKRVKSGKGSQKSSKDDPDDLSSCSDMDENEKTEGENGGGEMSPYYCRHCFTSTSRDWHHIGKEKLLVCRDCRIHYKRYAEYPPLDGEQKRIEYENMKKELEQKAKEEEEEEDAEILKDLAQNNIKDELSISAIEKDSEREDCDGTPQPGGSVTSEPIAMKAELPKSVRSLFSPVASVPQTVSPSAKSNPDIQVLEHLRGPSNLQVPQIPHQQSALSALMQQQGASQPSNSNSMPGVPREASPPPKPDGAECHRSQSAIFTRVWNRGESNSCSRTDMIFKPVPDSKLALKREVKLRKASEREEALKVEAAKRAQQEAYGHAAAAAAAAGHPGGHPLFNPADFRVPTPTSLPRPHHFPGHPLDTRPQAHLYPPGFAPAPPPPSMASIMDAERRRIDELNAAARASAERQYAERMSALATDPLVRLQMAGVNPEIPGSHPFGPPGSHLGLRTPPSNMPRPPAPPPPGLDPRFRSDMFLRPGYFSSPEFLQRQFMLEREQSLLAAHQNAVAHQSLLAQQEDLIRLEQESRARQAAAAAAAAHQQKR